MSELTEQTICFEAQRVANRMIEIVSNMDRPSVIHKPRLSQDGKYWQATLGALIGVGDSPDEAMFHFDNAWHKRLSTDSGDTMDAMEAVKFAESQSQEAIGDGIPETGKRFQQLADCIKRLVVAANCP